MGEWFFVFLSVFNDLACSYCMLNQSVVCRIFNKQENNLCSADEEMCRCRM